jgi:hypothetical protein
VDLRAYYKKLREVERGIADPFPVVVSVETTDGGREGVKTEVARHAAAKQIVEGRARIATVDETRVFHEENHAARLSAEQVAAVNRMQFVVLPTKSPVKGSKE